MSRTDELLAPPDVIVLTDGATSARPDRLLHLLRAVGDLATGAGPDQVRALEEVLADACPALAVWVEALPRALHHAVAEDAVRQGRPLVRRTADLPYRSHPQLPDEALLLAVPDDRAAPTRVGFVVRDLDAHFSPTDVARAEAVLALAGPLLGAAGPARSTVTAEPPGGPVGARPDAPTGRAGLAGATRPRRRAPERLVVDEQSLRTLGRYRLHRRYGLGVGRPAWGAGQAEPAGSPPAG